MKSPFIMLGMLALVGCAGSLDRPERFTEGTPEAYAAFQAACSKDSLQTFRADLAPTQFPVNVLIDTDTTSNDDIGSILDGIEAWNERVGFEAFYATITQDVATKHGMCNYATLTTDVHLKSPWAGLTTYGECAADDVYVETMHTPDVEDQAYYTARAVQQIAMHELGHVAGLDHEAEETSIMYASVSDSPLTITQQSACLVQKAFFRSKGF